MGRKLKGRQIYSYAGELRSIRCCDCGVYVNSHYTSAITSYKKQCLKTGRFVWAMQNPCDYFRAFNEKFIVQSPEQTKEEYKGFRLPPGKVLGIKDLEVEG